MVGLVVRRTGIHKSTAINTTLGDAGHNINFDCPTNPSIKMGGITPSSDNYVCAEIRTDDSTPTTMVNLSATLASGTFATHNENLEKTPGYRVKTFINETQTGQQFNSINLLTHDYFILLFADDIKQHHFAKITAEVTDDVEGDSLEFTPKLGNEIPKGTKFIVFKGPAITDTSVIAVTAGLLVTASETTHLLELMVSRPLVYFYNDRLVKKNQLDHNTKYKLCYAYGTATSPALSTISVFITVQDHHMKIIDNSKDSLVVDLVDMKRYNDDPRNAQNTGFVYDDRTRYTYPSSNFFNSYDNFFPNARRDANDDATAISLDGPYTYIYYEESPERQNRINEMYHSKVFNSIKDKTGFAESKLVDGGRTFSIKHNISDSYNIREKIGEADLRGWFETELTLDSVISGSTQLVFKTVDNYEARLLWGENEEIKIGDYIGFVNVIGAASSNLHTVVCQNAWRLETESNFSTESSAPFSVGDKIYRRIWSPKTRTLMTTLPLDTDVTYTGLSAITSHPLDVDTLTYKINNYTLASYTESKYNKAKIILSDVNYTEKEYDVLFGDKTHSFFRLNPERNNYRTVNNNNTSLDYATGRFIIELPIFTGSVEEITEDIENAQPVVLISGRDNFSKLVSPIINKNTVFSKDLIHSSMSPLSSKTAAKTSGGANVTINGDQALNTTTVNVSAAISGLSVQDILYDANNHFIGIVASGHGGTAIVLEFGSCVSLTNGNQIYVQSTNKHYTFKKALSSSAKNSNTVSGLDGASNKGIYFTSGVSVTDKTYGITTGNKEFVLAGTSASSFSNAVGYNFDSISSISKDNAFQSKLKDDFTGAYTNIDVVNGLSDFIVLDTKGEDKSTTISLAPRVGLYLGRVDSNDIYDSDHMTLADTTMDAVTVSLAYGIKTTSTAINTHFKRGEPVFTESGGVHVFQGYFIRAEVGSGGGSGHYTNNEIKLDRQPSACTGHNIFKLGTKNTTDMYFINKPASLIQLASPFVSNTWGLLPFNINLHDDSDSTISSNYIKRYGAPYYKFLDLERGNYNAIDEYPIEEIIQVNLAGTGDAAVNEEVVVPRVYYSEPSKTNYYALAYRFNPAYLGNTPVTTTTISDDSSFSTAQQKQGFFEKRGNKPSRGTNFFDYYLTGNTHTRLSYPISGLAHGMNRIVSREWEKTLRQMDAKVSRNFLFTTCDLLPESDLRRTSLYYGARDLTDFNIMLKTRGSASTISSSHTSYLGGGNSITDSDDDNPIMNISSAPEINTLKKFSMLRLVEMTLDWHFNSVDAENLPDKSKTLQLNSPNRMANLFRLKDSGGNNLTISSNTSAGANRIFLSAAPDNLDSSKNYLFFTEEGNYIGYGAAQAWAQIIVFSAKYDLTGPHVHDSFALTDGVPIYAFCIDASSYNDLYVRGHNSQDTFVSMPKDGAIHMLKGAVFQNEVGRTGTMDGYAEDNDDAYHDTYLPDNDGDNHFSLVDNLASEKRTASIALPPTFTVEDTTRTTLSGVRLRPNLEIVSIVHGVSVINNNSVNHEFILQDQSSSGTSETTNFKSALTDYGPSGTNTLTGIKISLLPPFGNPADHISAVLDNDFPWSGKYYSISGRDADKLIGYSAATYQYETPSAPDVRTDWIGYRIRNEPSDLDNYCLLVSSDVSALTNNLQYHIWLTSGQYLGKTAAGQTYGEKYLIMEYCYYDTKFRSYSSSNRELKYSLAMDESLVNTEGNMHISEVIRSIAVRDGSTNHLKNLYTDTLAVFLDRFDIEDGGQSSVSAGMVSSELGKDIPLLQSLSGHANSPHKVMIETHGNSRAGLSPSSAKLGFGHYKSTELTESTDGSSPYIADGATMLFKPYLKFKTRFGHTAYSASQSVVSVGNGTAKLFEFTVQDVDGADGPTTKHNAWLNYAPNLTGCYLVSHHGKQYGLNKHGNNQSDPTVAGTATTEAFQTSDTSHSGAAGHRNATLKGTFETVPSYIHYIISHTIKRTADCTKHQIVIDNAGTVGEVYKVMRIAENTFYDFTPKKVKLNTLTPEYTKMAYEDKCYEPTKSFRFHNARYKQFVPEVRLYDPTNTTAELYAETGFGEGVSSMYVIADPSNIGSGNHLVYRTPSEYFGTDKIFEHSHRLRIGMSDGENNLDTELISYYLSDFNLHEIHFNVIKNMVGAVSIGQVFDITVPHEKIGKYTDATIGCGANICFEADDLLNDLFEDEGLEATKRDVNEYPVFLSPDFKGVSLQTASNYLLTKKNRRITYDKKFILTDSDSVTTKPKLLISESDKNYSVKSIKKGKKLFDLHNEVNVYGRNIKSQRKNIKSINKSGKKTIEVIDDNIYTQDEADKLAIEILHNHSELGELIEIEVRADNLFILKAGDTIQLSFPTQKIPKAEYLVIETEYTLDGFTKLKLGNNTKNISDRFTEALLKDEKLRGLARTKSFKEPSKSNNFYEDIKIKEIRIKIRKRLATAGATLGFATVLNTSTTPMGFTGGSAVTYTDLVEEEL